VGSAQPNAATQLFERVHESMKGSTCRSCRELTFETEMIYIYIYHFIYIYIYIYLSLYIYIYIYIYLSLYIYIYIYLSITLGGRTLRTTCLRYEPQLVMCGTCAEQAPAPRTSPHPLPRTHNLPHARQIRPSPSPAASI